MLPSPTPNITARNTRARRAPRRCGLDMRVTKAHAEATVAGAGGRICVSSMRRTHTVAADVVLGLRRWPYEWEMMRPTDRAGVEVRCSEQNSLIHFTSAVSNLAIAEDMRCQSGGFRDHSHQPCLELSLPRRIRLKSNDGNRVPDQNGPNSNG